MHITAIYDFFNIKTMKKDQFMDYLDKNFSYWLRMTLHENEITLFYENIGFERSCFHGNHYYLLANLQVESDFNIRHARGEEPKCRSLLS